MSVWMTVTITLNKGSKVSVRRAAESIWGDDELTVHRTVHPLDNLGFQAYSVRLCREGVQELGNLKALLERIKEYDPNCNVTMVIDNLNLY